MMTIVAVYVKLHNHYGCLNEETLSYLIIFRICYKYLYAEFNWLVTDNSITTYVYILHLNNYIIICLNNYSLYISYNHSLCIVLHMFI